MSQLVRYLRSLSRPINPNCERGHYYLLNNYKPGYYGDGRNAYADITNPNETVFTIPPSTLRNIGDAMNEKNISWAYYGDQWNTYLANPDGNYVTADNTYCNICNPFQYSTSIMTSASGARAQSRTRRISTTPSRTARFRQSRLSSPSGWLDGHPASSKLNLFEGFVKKIVDGVKANPKLWDEHRHHRHLRRGRRLLGFRLRAAAGLLRRRHPHSDDRGLALDQARPHLARLHRPCLDPEVHRGNWRLSPLTASQPRQLPQSARQPQQSLRAAEQPSHRRHDGPVRLRRAGISEPEQQGAVQQEGANRIGAVGADLFLKLELEQRATADGAAGVPAAWMGETTSLQQRNAKAHDLTSGPVTRL